MKRFLLALVALALPSALHAQAVLPVDTAALQAQVIAAQAKADLAKTTADAAQTTASSAVQTVNTVTPVAGNVTIPTTQFVSGFTSVSPGTWANLLSTAPCNAGRLALYAVVSDLYGGTGTNEVARCGVTGTTYYDYANNAWVSF